MSSQRLGNLVPDAPLTDAERRLPIAGVTTDSRAVEPGFLFVAVPGTRADGISFVPAAVAAGAAAVLAEKSVELPPGVPLVRVADVRRALAQVARRFYPHAPATIAAVTGTNGKTSVAAFLRQIWTALGHPAASLGTIGLVSPKGEDNSNLTTPDPLALHRIADRLAGEGVTHLAIEASSHGLDQHRLDGLKLAAGAFTNLSRDHLDYHETVEAYRAAKLRLFSEVLPVGAAAVICADGAEAEHFCAAALRRGLRLFTVGRRGRDITLLSAEPEGFGQNLRVSYRGEEFSINLPLAGDFQVENTLVAAGLALATGGAPDRVFDALENLAGAKGRLERAGEIKGALVVIDYAHTPDALANVLETLRPYAKNRLIALFGAGGDRDPGKRPLMAAAAAEKADLVIVTDDNPRSEDPAHIRSQVLAGAPDAREIGDRAEAIAAAVAALKEGDVLLVAGKGHETGQIIGDRTLPFSDHEAVRAAIEAQKK